MPKGVELVISNGHRGMQESVTRSFLGAAWQFCHVHFMRFLMKLIPKKKQSSVMQIVKKALENESLVSKAQGTLIQEGLVKASDMFERLNFEFKRRTRKIGAFPSEQCLLRLVVTIMMDINEEWITGRKYMNIEVD